VPALQVEFGETLGSARLYPEDFFQTISHGSRRRQRRRKRPENIESFAIV
jgi:hypothetical protein